MRDFVPSEGLYSTPGPLLPATSAGPSGMTDVKSLFKRSELQTTRNQILDFLSVICVEHKIMIHWEEPLFSNISLHDDGGI